MRTTRSAVRLTIRPRRSAAAMTGAASRSSSRPHIRPQPRTSRTIGTRAASWPQPRFEMGTGRAGRGRAGRPRADRGRRAPRGRRAGCRRRSCRGRRRRSPRPPAATAAPRPPGTPRRWPCPRRSDRARARVAGCGTACPCARPALHLVGDQQRARSTRRPRGWPRRVSAGSGRTPPSPWIGSAITAAVDSLTAARSAAGSRGRHERHARDERLERPAVVLVPGDRQRAHRAAAERVLEARRCRCVPTRPARASSGGRTSGTPRPPRCRCCRRTRATGRTSDVSRRASCPCSGWKNRFEVCTSVRGLLGQRVREARVGVAERRDADARTAGRGSGGPRCRTGRRPRRGRTPRAAAGRSAGRAAPRPP